MHPFHLAFPVDNLESARHFYGGLLGCPEGRSSDEWIDFNLFGHQIVAHLAHGVASNDVHSDVDGKKSRFGILELCSPCRSGRLWPISSKRRAFSL
jgi:extradiol dioxygenase family protein